jgi:ribulose-phosphate 3-epimerase
MDPLIIPAIIAKKPRDVEKLLSRLSGKVNRVMLDFMDGCFVPNFSLDFNLILPKTFQYEAHLMVLKPLERLEDIALDIDWAILHIETLEDVSAAIEKTKAFGLNISLALNPSTSVLSAVPYLDDIDGLLIMTVEPGRYGNKFLPEMLEKIRKLREIDKNIYLEVDGGMTPITVKAAKKAGANAFASGSFIFKKHDISDALMALKKAAQK